MDVTLLKDLRWRIADTREILMSVGIVSGERLYGCDEWSTPTVNLQLAIDKIDAALAAALTPAAEAVEYPEAAQVCGEAYQVVGSLLSDVGMFDTEMGDKILDNLSQHRLVHKDILPWPAFVTPQPTQAAEAVIVETFGFVRQNSDGERHIDWTLEGGIDALEVGDELLVCNSKITDDTGAGEVFTTPQPAPVVDDDNARLLRLATQWERDAHGCRRDGYTDAAVVKGQCARELRAALAPKPASDAEEGS